MANITLSVPDDLHKRMKLMREIRWSEVVRRAIEKKVDAELLVSEAKFQDWAVGLQGEGRSDRYKELRKKGLI
jgi:hypothetical protein